MTRICVCVWVFCLATTPRMGTCSCRGINRASWQVNKGKHWSLCTGDRVGGSEEGWRVFAAQGVWVSTPDS